jgi:hypothetical protein
MKKTDFEDFMAGEEISPSKELDRTILSYVHRKMNPTGLQIFQKLTLIQLVTGMATLLFCPQFGISLTGSTGLMGVLMKYGDNVCIAGCGALFLSSSALASILLLRPEELRVLKRNQLLQFPVLALTTLGIFICLGAPVISTLGISWFMGSMLGGFLTFGVAQKLKNQFA